MAYAVKTPVTVDKTRAEIEKLVTSHGATRFMNGWEEGAAAVLFEMKDRRVRFRLSMPDPKDKKFTRDKSGRDRTPSAAKELCAQATRSAWRGLLLVIRAKLESVESGIETFEEAFLTNIVVPGSGETFGEWAIPQIAEAYERGGKMPPLLGPWSS